VITNQTYNTESSSKYVSSKNGGTCQAPETLINELSEIEIKRALRKISSTAKSLASSAPPANRKEMEKLLNIGLYIQQRFEQSQQIPKQDINGALAIFLYGIWSINNQGNQISGESFSRLITSTHEVLTNWGDFLREYDKSAHGKRQSLYETFAMVGNWLLMIQHHLNSQPDDTALNNVKIMVREIIIRSLKIEPESILISQDGSLTLVPKQSTHEISA
jgi:hypothetical protein